MCISLSGLVSKVAYIIRPLKGLPKGIAYTESMQHHVGKLRDRLGVSEVRDRIIYMGRIGGVKETGARR